MPEQCYKVPMTRLSGILLGVLLSGCAGTGDGSRPDGGINAAEQRKPELVENRTSAFSRSPTFEVEAEKRREGDAPRYAPRSRLVSFSLNEGRGSVSSDYAMNGNTLAVATPAMTLVAASLGFEVPEALRETLLAFQDAESSPEETTPERATSNPDDRWRFVIAPYGWLASIEGDVKIGSIRADIDTKFKDVLDDLSWGLEARIEAWKGKWGITFDPSILVLESEASVGGVDVDSKSTLSLVGFAINRVLYESAPEERGDRALKIEGGIGGIWTNVRAEIDFSGVIPDLDERADWVDPVVGLRGTARLSDRWTARVGGAVGGFDLGEASKFTWLAESFLGYRLSAEGSTRLRFGYRALGFERSQGMLDIDLIMHGPVLGVSFHF